MSKYPIYQFLGPFGWVFRVKAYSEGSSYRFFRTNSEENDNECIHDRSKKYVFLRDYWISKIKNITKKLLYFNGEWGEHSKKSSEKKFLLCQKLDPHF